MTSAAELARQVREAEALVARLERGEKATPKDSAPVRMRETSRGGRYGNGPNLIPTTHAGSRGKSLIEMIRDDLRTTIDTLEKSLEGYSDRKSAIAHEFGYEDGLIDGIAHALGILRGNEGEEERREEGSREEKRDFRWERASEGVYT